jgi:hypothetical protein
MKSLKLNIFALSFLFALFLNSNLAIANEACSYTVKPWFGQAPFTVNINDEEQFCERVNKEFSGSYTYEEFFTGSLRYALNEKQVNQPWYFAKVRPGSRMIARIDFTYNGHTRTRLWIGRAIGWSQCDDLSCVHLDGRVRGLYFKNTLNECRWSRRTEELYTYDGYSNQYSSCTMEFENYGLHKWTDYRDHIDIKRPNSGQVLTIPDISGTRNYRDSVDGLGRFQPHTGQIGLRVFNYTDEISSGVTFYKIEHKKFKYYDPTDEFELDSIEPVTGFVRRGLGKINAQRVESRSYQFQIPDIPGYRMSPSYSGYSELIITVQTHTYNSKTNRWNVLQATYSMTESTPRPQSIKSASYPANLGGGSGLTLREINRTVRLQKGL